MISAAVLSKMKETAEAVLSPATVDKAVVTVPAYFHEPQKVATIQAAKIAGLTVERTVDEPTAAAIAYALDKRGEMKVLVYDLGGGTFDVTVLEAEDGLFFIEGVAGNDSLGGRDFDEKVVNLMLKNGLKKYPDAADKERQIRENPRKMAKLQSEAEKAKRLLSVQLKVDIQVDNFFGDEQDFEVTITRAQFNKECAPLFKSTIEKVEEALKVAGVSKEELDEVVLVGGSTRIPAIEEEVTKWFGRAPFKGLHPDEAVCQGAAIQANALHGVRDEFTKDILLVGEFDLSGIPPAPRGQPQIKVTFELDANSVLAVTALVKGTGKSSDMKVKPKSTTLSDEDVERMVKEAEKFAEQDRLFREKNEARQKLEGYCFGLSQMIDDDRKAGRLSAGDKEAVREAAEACQEWLDDEVDQYTTAEEFNEKRDEIEERVRPILERAEEFNEKQ